MASRLLCEPPRAVLPTPREHKLGYKLARKRVAHGRGVAPYASTATSLATSAQVELSAAVQQLKIRIDDDAHIVHISKQLRDLNSVVDNLCVIAQVLPTVAVLVHIVGHRDRSGDHTGILVCPERRRHLHLLDAGMRALAECGKAKKKQTRIQQTQKGCPPTYTALCNPALAHLFF